MSGQIDSKRDHCVRTWSFDSKGDKDNKAVCGWWDIRGV